MNESNLIASIKDITTPTYYRDSIYENWLREHEEQIIADERSTRMKECEFIKSVKEIPECSVCSRPLTAKEVAGQIVYHGFADNGNEFMVCQECLFIAIQKLAEEEKDDKNA